MTDPHAPYVPTPEFRERFASDVDPSLGYSKRVTAISIGEEEPPEGLAQDWISLYDAEIAMTDASLGNFVEALKERELFEDAIMIVTSDHGEEFQDHGGWGARPDSV